VKVEEKETGILLEKWSDYAKLFTELLTYEMKIADDRT
jgi:hypothetical protein